MYFVYLMRSGVMLKSEANLTQEEAHAWCQEAEELLTNNAITSYGSAVLEEKEISNAS